MAVYMEKSDSMITIEEGQRSKKMKQTKPLAPIAPELEQKQAGVNDGLGIGGNKLMDKPQTLDQQPAPLMEKPAMNLSMRDLQKILEEE